MRPTQRRLARTLLLLLLILGRPAPDAHSDDACAIALTDVTEAAGLGAAKGDRFSFGDYDGDGDPDLLIQGRALYRNDTRGAGTETPRIVFTDVSKESGIAKGPGGGAIWIDVDQDGDLDVVTTSGALKIQQPAGTFQNRAAAWGLQLEKPMQSVGAGDLDGDGFPEVLFGGGENWNDGNPVYFPRLLLKNVSGSRFESATADHDLADGKYGRAVAFADYDADGDLDVYLGNYRLMANELLVNEGGVLVNRAAEAGVAGRRTDDRTTLPNGQSIGYRYGHTIASSWADLDGDGDLDLWVSNLVHKFAGMNNGQYDVRGWICDDSAIYRNDGPPTWGFTDVRAESGIPLKPTGDRGVFRGDELWSNAACADLDGDGLPEVLVTQVYALPYSHALLFRNCGDLRFEEISQAVGLRRFNSYGGAFADVDGDGDSDLVTNGTPEPKGEREVKLHRNDTPPSPWVAFRLVGPRGDPRPVGARVCVSTKSGERFVRQIDSAMGSHGQQNEGLLRFGLRGQEIETVQVRWPGGIIQRLDDVETGRIHDVTEPAKVPTVRLDPPETDNDGSVRLRARSKRGSLAWAYCFDLDGDGVFETKSKDGKARIEAGGAREVRVRVWRRSRGVGREAVWRLGDDR